MCARVSLPAHKCQPTSYRYIHSLVGPFNCVLSCQLCGRISQLLCWPRQTPSDLARASMLRAAVCCSTHATAPVAGLLTLAGALQITFYCYIHLCTLIRQPMQTNSSATQPLPSWRRAGTLLQDACTRITRTCTRGPAYVGVVASRPARASTSTASPPDPLCMLPHHFVPSQSRSCRPCRPRISRPSCRGSAAL